MRKLALLALIALFGGFFYIVRDPGHVPALDANLNVLAESRQAGWCAGYVWFESGANPTAKRTAECRATNDMSTDVDMTAAQESFCRGVVDAGWQATAEHCLGIVQDQNLWPLYDGGYTAQWSKQNPYPWDRILDTPSESRTGEREGLTR